MEIHQRLFFLGCGQNPRCAASPEKGYTHRPPKLSRTLRAMGLIPVGDNASLWPRVGAAVRGLMDLSRIVQYRGRAQGIREKMDQEACSNP